MNHKNINNEKLIAFLYGEISAEERKEVEEYLKANPDKQGELEEMGNVRSIMAKYEDEEKIHAPKINLQRESGQSWVLRYWSVAATILLLISFGWIGYNSSNNKPEKIETIGFTKEQLEDILKNQRQLSSANESLVKKVDELESTIQKLEQDQLALINNIESQDNSGNEIVKEYFASLQEQNQKSLNEYFLSIENNQKQYIEAVLTDFANYVNEQRERDLLVIQNRIINLEQNTGEVKYATEQIMASLTSTDVNYKNQ